MTSPLLRKLRSAAVRLAGGIRSHLKRFSAVYLQDGIAIGEGFHAGPHVLMSATEDGALTLGRNVALGFGTRLVCAGGRLCIGDDVFLGSGCIVVTQASIEIGDGTQIAEYVVIRDQDHKTGVGSLTTSGFEASPISIGRNCWLGAKVTVLRGARIGDGAVIGAHSVVKGDIPAGALAVGCPARVIRWAKGASGVATPPSRELVCK